MTPERLAQLVAERMELDYDLLAEKIAAQLERPAQANQLVSAEEIAQQLGRTARWVRERKAELGAVPMSDGPRPRLGFDPAYVDRLLADRRL